MSKWASVSLPLPTQHYKTFYLCQSCKWKMGSLYGFNLHFLWNWTSLYISHLYFFLESETGAFFISGFLRSWQLFLRCYFKMYLSFREFKFDQMCSIIKLIELDVSLCFAHLSVVGWPFSYWFVGAYNGVSTLDISCNFCPVCHQFLCFITLHKTQRLEFCTRIELTIFMMSRFCIIPCPILF